MTIVSSFRVLARAILLLGGGLLPMAAVQAADTAPTRADIAAAVAPNAASTPDATAKPNTAPTPDAAATASAERVVWQGDPIPIVLKVNVERRIDFPEPIAEIAVADEIEHQSRMVLSPTGQLLWTPRSAFAPTRVLATSVSGSLYQLDVSARVDGKAGGRLLLTDPTLEASMTAKANAADARALREQAAARLIPDFLKESATTAGTQKNPGYVAMTRFALAHFTGPSRLIPKLDAMRVAVRPIDTDAWLRIQSVALTIQPMAQWRVGNLYVTVLDVLNRSEAEVAFDPRAFRGELLFAAALHSTLGPRGSGHSRSIWAMVTSQPFNRVLDYGPALTVDR